MLVMFHSKEKMMKKVLITLLLALSVTTVYAQVRCVPSGGGTCCWDINKDGPWKPIGC